jgi:single-strand DNA-binding protein
MRRRREMSETYVTVVGNVATTPEHRVTQSGATLAKFRLATTPRRLDRTTGRWGDGPTSFYTVVCWRALADNVTSSVGKGDPVVVVGRLRVTSWDNERGSGTVAEIEGVHVGHDLGKGIAMFRKIRTHRPAEPDRRAAHGGGEPGRGEEPVDRRVAAGIDAGSDDLDDDLDAAIDAAIDAAVESGPLPDSGPLVAPEPGAVSRDTAA